MGKRGLLTIVLCALAALASASGDRLRWYMSFDMAQRIAKQTHKILLIDIYVDGSAQANRMLNETFTSKQVMAATSNFVLVRLNSTREGSSVGLRYGINGGGGIVFAAPDGRFIHRVLGFYGPRSMMVEMEKARLALRDKAAYLARYKKNPKDGLAAARLAAIYAYELDVNRMSTMLAAAEKYRSAKDTYLLPEAYNAVGDYYQIQRKFQKAIPYFRKAVAVGKRPYDLAYSYISIGSCYMSLKDRDNATVALQAVNAVPGVSSDDLGIAKELMMSLYRSGGAGGRRR